MNPEEPKKLAMEGVTVLITDGPYAKENKDDKDVTATVIQVNDFKLHVKIDSTDVEGFALHNLDGPTLKVSKKHAKYVIGPHVQNCVQEIMNRNVAFARKRQATRDAKAAYKAERVRKEEAKKQAKSEINDDDSLFSNDPTYTSEEETGYDNIHTMSMTLRGVPGAAIASQNNNVARRNVKRNNSSKNNKSNKTPRTSATKSSNVTAKAKATAKPVTRSSTKKSSLPPTITNRPRNNNAGAVSDGSSELVPHSEEVAMDESIIPHLQKTLISAYHSLQYNKKKFMNAMENLAEDLPDNYDGVHESYPGKSNK